MATAAPSAPRGTRVPPRGGAGGSATAPAGSPSLLRERRPGGPIRPRPKTAPPRGASGRRAAQRRRATLRDSAVAAAALLDRLLRGRAWVALIALLLTGIVFLNVSLLEVNGEIARTDARNAELRRQIGDLRMRAARLGSTERLQRAAAAHGLVAAPPGRIGYLRPGRRDAARAARALEDWRPERPVDGAGAAADRAGAASSGAPSPGTAAAGTAAPTGAGARGGAETGGAASAGGARAGAAAAGATGASGTSGSATTAGGPSATARASGTRSSGAGTPTP